jgi:hypothetical protein
MSLSSNGSATSAGCAGATIRAPGSLIVIARRWRCCAQSQTR